MKWCSLLILIFVLFSCKKERIEADFIVAEIPTQLDVRNIETINDDTIFACGGELWTGGFIARSIDAGQNWEIVKDHWKIINVIRANNQHKLLAGSHWGGLHYSSDGGNTWSYNENSVIAAVNDLTFLDEHTALLATGESFYFGGYCLYNTQQNSYDFRDYSQSFASLKFFDNQHGLMGAYGTVYSTTDGGMTIKATNISGDFFKGISFNDNGEGIAIGYQGKVWLSKNKGNSWERIDNKKSFFTSKGNLESVTVFDKQVLICGQDGKLLYSNDLGNSWAEVNHPFEKRNFYKVVFINSNQAWLCGGGGLLSKIIL